MSNESYDFDSVERFTAGAIGPKGQRVFYLQAIHDASIVALRLEKQQVLALAEYLGSVLDDLPPTELHDLPDDLDLVDPVVADWVIASIGVAYAESEDRVVIWTEELMTEDADADLEPATARFRLTREQVTAFIVRARELVAAGRPPCPYCGRPLDGDGTWCACSN